MAKHEKPGKSDEWYTPPRVFDALGVRFDIDVAYPWYAEPDVPADRFICKGGLEADWTGFVWMNPPFGGRNGIKPWLDKFFAHGNGVALTPDRTSAPWWQEAATKADLILFVNGKIRFIPGPGVKESSPAQGTSLMASGARGVKALRTAAENGLGLCR
jgi:hypothetical protein